eukprot:CAMPEP_0116920244 /NCGR_PEP_ID=MMETSP0467-20121206/20889_1 /TAXON_ID=283647 /ORGANISM="Mesodinium pulex, Strain SPMC105" /LENGTH=95 /DNA_ID=CAMNT_0004598023 /DNA_START=215 /DNA_END=502 /DNA_ORIENTATION=+
MRLHVSDKDAMFPQRLQNASNLIVDKRAKLLCKLMKFHNLQLLQNDLEDMTSVSSKFKSMRSLRKVQESDSIVLEQIKMMRSAVRDSRIRKTNIY